MGFAFEQQTQVQFPQVQFQSTSSYQSVTSYTPQITEVGAINVYGSHQSTVSHRNGPRRGINDPNEPYMTPVGDVPFIFMLSLCLLVILHKQFRKNDVKYIE
jgi:hypothetical protein